MGQGKSARVRDDLRQDGITDEQGWNPLPDIPEDIDDDDGSLWESRVRGEVGIDLFDRDGLTSQPPPPPAAVVLAGGLVLIAVAPEWILVGEITLVVGIYVALNEEDDAADDVLDDDRDDYGWDEVPENEPAAEDYDGILENRKLVESAIPRASPYVGGRGPRPPWWRNLPPQAQDKWVKLFRWDPYTKRYFLKWGWEKLAVLVGMEQIADLMQQLDMVIGQFTGGIEGGGLGAAGTPVGGGGPNGSPGSSGGDPNVVCEVVDGDPDIDGDMLWCEEVSPFLGYGGHTNGPISPIPPAPKLAQLVSVDGMTAMVAVLDTATGIVRHKQYVRVA